MNCPKCQAPLCKDWKRWGMCGHQRLESLSPSDAASCSRIVGYRLEDGTDKAELYFLPGRPAQKTLNQMADLIKSGWMVTGIIYSENV